MDLGEKENQENVFNFNFSDVGARGIPITEEKTTENTRTVGRNKKDKKIKLSIINIDSFNQPLTSRRSTKKTPSKPRTPGEPTINGDSENSDRVDTSSRFDEGIISEELKKPNSENNETN
jgi:hypothetical protein